MTRVFPLVLLLLASLSQPAFAQATDPATTRCYENEGYLVIGQDYAEQVGTKFIVFRKHHATDTLPCSFDPHEADFVIGVDPDPLHFEALEGDHLVLVSSTGPQGDIMAYNLDTEELVLDRGLIEIEAITEVGITFWQSWEKGTADNCPIFAENEANFLSSTIALERTFYFDVDDISSVDTAPIRCFATQ